VGGSARSRTSAGNAISRRAAGDRLGVAAVGHHEAARHRRLLQHHLAQRALALLDGYEMVYAGKTPSAEDIVALFGRHDPVAIMYATTAWARPRGPRRRR